MCRLIHGFLVGGVLVGSLFLGGVCAQGKRPESGQEQAASIELTNSHPKSSFAVSADVLARSPSVVALSFTRVVNPARTAFAIFVYLSYRPPEAVDAAPLKILVGNGSLYPADRPGGFLLRVSAAFGKLKAAKATDVRLVLEMRRIHPAEPWFQVEVTAAPPQWRSQ